MITRSVQFLESANQPDSSEPAPEGWVPESGEGGEWKVYAYWPGMTAWKRYLAREELPPNWEWQEFEGAVAARLPGSLSVVIVWWDGTVSASAGTPWEATQAAVRRARRLLSSWRPSVY